MGDYTYPSVYLAYLLFAVLFVLAVYFCVRSIKHGYWGKRSEEAKYRMMDDE